MFRSVLLSAHSVARSIAARTVLYLMAVASGILGARLAWAGAYPRNEGLRVVNPLHTTLIPWDSINRIELGEYLFTPMAFVVSLDGSRLHIYGIDGTASVRRTETLIQELNALVAKKRQSIGDVRT